jgi:Tfp pilus assembly PilM family ATPase
MLKSLIISFSGKKITIAEIGEKNEILFLETLVSDYDMNGNITMDRFNDSMIYSCSDLINSVIKGKKYDEHKVGLLMDSSIAFFNLMPIDYKEPVDNIRSQILWDLSNYFPQNYKEFSVNYFRMKKANYSPHVQDTLIIAMHKVKMEFFKSIFDFCNLYINITDIDHLSAEKCIKKVYSNDFRNKKNLIIGIKKNRADLSIIDNNNLYYFDYLNTDSGLFQERLVKTLSFFYERDLNLFFNKIFLYGDDGLNHINKLVSSVFPEKETIITNPLSIFNYSAIRNTVLNFENEGYKYTPLLGLALKSV